MLDIKLIREHPEQVKDSIKRRHLEGEQFDVDAFLGIDQKRTKLIQQAEELRAERNRLSDIKEKPSAETIAAGKKLKDEIKSIDEQIVALNEKWQWYMDWFPNIPNEAMPDGNDDSGNKEIKSWGEKRRFDFEPKHHLDIGESLDLINVQKAGEVAGSRFFFIKNEAALMQWGIFNIAIKKLRDRGFDLVIPPVILKRRPLYGTGYFPSEEDQVYELRGDQRIEDDQKHYLAGTSEQALVALHMDEIIEITDEKPIRYAGLSSCFRSEAGSWGRDVRGIKRGHQFDKVEMIYFTTPETSQLLMMEASEIEEEILRDLGLTYHIMEMCTGDVGLATHRKFDVEVWMPSQGEWMETHSNSDLASFHTRRLNIRYRKNDGMLDYPHTLSSTAITNSRPIAAILDNYQQADGSVVVPEVLREYVGKDVISVK